MPNIEDSKVSVKTWVTILVAGLVWAFSLGSVYTGLSNQLKAQGDTIAVLTLKLAESEKTQQSIKETLIDLTATLRTKEIIK